jgi:hypothetical protein
MWTAPDHNTLNETACWRCYGYCSGVGMSRTGLMGAKRWISLERGGENRRTASGVGGAKGLTSKERAELSR